MIVDNGGQSLQGVGLPDPRWGHPHWGCQQPGVVCCCGQRHLPGRSSHTALQVMTKIHNHTHTITSPQFYILTHLMWCEDNTTLWGSQTTLHPGLLPSNVLTCSGKWQVDSLPGHCVSAEHQLSKEGFNFLNHLPPFLHTASNVRRDRFSL